LPDDYSYFYVNYYVQEGRRRLTDRNPGSVITTLTEAFAREFAVLHKQMEMIYQSAFVDLATGTSLDHVAALLAINRKDAKFGVAKRSLNAVRRRKATSRFRGTLVSTDQGRILKRPQTNSAQGAASMAAPIRAQVEGRRSRRSRDDQEHQPPIFGIESVLNEAATSLRPRRRPMKSCAGASKDARTRGQIHAQCHQVQPD